MPDDPFVVIYIIGMAVGSAIRAVFTWRHEPGRPRGPHRAALDDALLLPAGLGMFAFPVAYVLTPWLDFADYDLPGAAGWTGAGVFALALCLLWRSHADLGANWSPRVEIREDGALVTRGVYRRVRHPMYAAHWLWAVAQAMLLQNWIAGPAMLVLFAPGYLVRVRREEEVMLKRYGPAYEDYLKRTGRLLPRLRTGKPGPEEGPSA